MLCCLQISAFLGFVIIQLSYGLTIVLNQYLSENELVYLTDVSFLICLYDCQKRSQCLSVNYHTKMHLCIENLARSNSEHGHFVQQSGCLYVDKDGTWDKILSQFGELQKPEFNNVCGPPPPLTDTVMLGNKWTEGGNVLYTYSCTSQPTTAAATCLQNGSWSDVQDLCSQTSTSGVRTDPTTLAENFWSSTLSLLRDTTTTDPQSSTTTEDIRRTPVTTFSLTSMPTVVSPITSQGTSAKASSLSTISQQIPSTTSDSVLTSQSTMSESSSSPSSTLSTSMSQETSITTSTSQPLIMSESTSSSSVSTTPSTVTTTSLSAICIQPSAPDCGILPYGDYQSCRGCGYYATCAPSGVATRPCSTGLVWDDSLKICSWTSSACVLS